MYSTALESRSVASGKKITYKTLVSAGLAALAVLLPQLIHLALGQPGGVQWLPMYLPVLIGGCLLGTRWGLAVGVCSPLLSFIITSAISEPMPPLPRLPFMVAELAVFAAISGLFGKKIYENGLWAFPAVICAQLSGRAVFLALIAATQSFTPFTVPMIRQQIKTGFIGLGVQAVIVPLIVIGLRMLIVKDSADE